MAIIEWDESIALHIPAIDAQHKELIGWINALYDAVQKGEGAQLIDEILQKLINYVCEHFAAEEQLMLSYNFPDFTSHRQEHDYFVQKLKEIQNGKFAKNWIAEYKSGKKNYNKLLKAGADHPIEKTGARLRGLMPWIGKKNIKGAQAAY